jgi:hypothetical protein
MGAECWGGVSRIPHQAEQETQNEKSEWECWDQQASGEARGMVAEEAEAVGEQHIPVRRFLSLSVIISYVSSTFLGRDGGGGDDNWTYTLLKLLR